MGVMTHPTISGQIKRGCNNLLSAPDLLFPSENTLGLVFITVAAVANEYREILILAARQIEKKSQRMDLLLFVFFTHPKRSSHVISLI